MRRRPMRSRTGPRRTWRSCDLSFCYVARILPSSTFAGWLHSAPRAICGPPWADGEDAMFVWGRVFARISAAAALTAAMLTPAGLAHAATSAVADITRQVLAG